MALTILTLFFICCVVFRFVISYRQIGNFGLRLKGSKSSPAAALASFLSVSAVVMITILSVADAIHHLTYDIPTLKNKFLALLLASTGIFISALAQHQMGKSWRLGVDPNEMTKLIRSGFYQYVRHPIYSGVIIWSLAFIFLIPNIETFIAVFTLFLSIYIQVIYVEEKHMLIKHKNEYLNYIKVSGRFWPKLKPRRKDKIE